MALSKRGDYWYGTTLEDLKAEVVRFSKGNKYEAVAFAPSQCGCGGKHFRLESDETEGVAQRTCSGCGETVLMGDSAEFVVDARLEKHFCICDSEVFELLSGVALYEGSNDVRWYYIGCRCSACSLVGVFAEWKCEGGDAAALLSKV
jgi:hypothetical protein